VQAGRPLSGGDRPGAWVPLKYRKLLASTSGVRGVSMAEAGASTPHWHLLRDGKQYGPLSDSELLRLAELGKLQPDDLVWKPGFDAWRPARSVPGLLSPPQSTAEKSTVLPVFETWGAQPAEIDARPTSKKRLSLWIRLIAVVCITIFIAGLLSFGLRLILEALGVRHYGPISAIAWIVGLIYFSIWGWKITEQHSAASLLGAGASESDASSAEEIPFSPSLPDVTKTQPIRAFSDGHYLLLLSRGVRPIGGSKVFAYEYEYVLTAVNARNKKVVCFVTLENSDFASNQLCVFEFDGSHTNYGSLAQSNLEAEFTKKGLLLLQERLRLGAIKEVTARP
jgi:hypothetical protein